MEAHASRLGDFSRLRPEARVAAWLMLGMAALIIGDQWYYWSTMEDFSFGYLVPVFVAFVLHDRWPLLKAVLLGDTTAQAPVSEKARSEGVLNFFAGLVVAGSLLLFLFGGFLRAITGPDTDSASALALGFGGFVLAMAFLISRTAEPCRAVTL